MGLDDSVEESVCTSSASHLSPPAEESSSDQINLCGDDDDVEELHVKRVLWCYCLQVEEEVKQKQACLVLTDGLVGLLDLVDWTTQDAGKYTVTQNKVDENSLKVQ